jgi:hypothetical protein
MAAQLMLAGVFAGTIYGIWKYFSLHNNEKMHDNRFGTQQRNLAQAPADMLHVRDGAKIVHIANGEPFNYIDRLTGLNSTPYPTPLHVTLDTGQCYSTYMTPESEQVLKGGIHHHIR